MLWASECLVVHLIVHCTNSTVLPTLATLHGWLASWLAGFAVFTGYTRDHLGPKIMNISPKIFRTKIVHTSGTFFVKAYFFNFIYTEKDTESEFHIQNINL